MTILVTGSAGFIGSFLTQRLLSMGYQVIVDNHNNYYDPKIKENRLNKFIKNEDYIHVRCDLEDKDKIEKIFIEHKIN